MVGLSVLELDNPCLPAVGAGSQLATELIGPSSAYAPPADRILQAPLGWCTSASLDGEIVPEAWMSLVSQLKLG